MAFSIGSAFMNIIPKVTKDAAADLQKDLKAVDVGAVGADWGKSLGKKLVKGLAALGIGKLIGDTISESFNLSAEFEQLAGGVEKIFDEADVSQIMTDAADAYVSLNMSANEYLAAINQVGATFAQTMGDQAGYETAKKGMQAIADYASGTGRSLDELNQKYTLITRSTSSYQSIADQFSGILPATSADFLEQAQAAGYLSEEYTKLTEVPIAEYQEAVTNMLEKGVTEMGLYGNTAAESYKTISGSINMMKSAWQNWLTGLASDEADMDKLTSQMVESLVAVISNAGPVLKRLIETFVRNLPQLIKGLIPTLKELVVELPEIILEILPDLISAGFELIKAILEGIIDAIPELVDKMIELGGQLIQGLIDGFQARVQEFIDLMGGTIGQAHEYASMVAEVASPSKKFRRLGNYMVQGLTLGIEDEAPNAAKAMEGAIYAGGAPMATVAYGQGVVGAIVALHDDLGKIISEYSPNGIDATRSYLGELQRKAAMIA